MELLCRTDCTIVLRYRCTGSVCPPEPRATLSYCLAFVTLFHYHRLLPLPSAFLSLSPPRILQADHLSSFPSLLRLFPLSPTHSSCTSSPSHCPPSSSSPSSFSYPHILPIRALTSFDRKGTMRPQDPPNTITRLGLDHHKRFMQTIQHWFYIIGGEVTARSS
ncbi:hypothetical protein BDQ17DRAFT_1358668 [Cyathus striatus]|nr:hypothetical protein BDQ17DRAFT_1358668 [Cyathus striatus]